MKGRLQAVVKRGFPGRGIEKLEGVGRKASKSLSNVAMEGEVTGLTPSSSRMCSSELAFNSASMSF